MKTKIALFLLLPLFFFSSLFSSHEEARFYMRSYPELGFLAGEDVMVTEEGTISDSPGPSFALFGKKYPELDRSLLSLRLFSFLKDGGVEAYRAFSQKQSEAKRLSFSTFQTLHQELYLLAGSHPTLSQEEMFHVIEVMIVLGEMGKSPSFKQRFLPYGVDEEDHDRFIEKALPLALSNKELFPSVASLNSAQKKLLLEGRKLGHYGHITHLEGGAEILLPAKTFFEENGSPLSLKVHFIAHTCNVAGALGHIEPASSLVCTEDVAKTLELLLKTLRTLQAPSTSVEKAYHHYLIERASWVGLDLDPKKAQDRVLGRLVCNLRLYSEAEGKALKEAYTLLPQQLKMEFERFFARVEVDTRAPTPTYLPAVFINMIQGKKEQGKCQEDAIKESVEDVLSWLVAFYKDPNVQNFVAHPICFNNVAATVKEAPHSLKGKSFTLDERGNLSLITQAN